MQANLNDLSTHCDSPSFVICQRVLHKCHDIVFGDQLLPSSSPYPGFKLPAYSRRSKVKHHAEPVFVGLGILLAGALGMPKLAEVTGQVAIEQGRADEEGDSLRTFQVDHEDAPSHALSAQSATQYETDESDSPSSLEEEMPSMHLPPETPKPIHGLITRRRTLGAQTHPPHPLHLQTIRKSRLSEDPLGQLDSESGTMPFQSSPSLTSARTAPRSATVIQVDTLLEKYDNQSQIQLLRGHYFLSEVSSSRILQLYGFEIQKGSIFTQP
jgi:phosphatidylinositol 4-kinase